MTRSGNKTFIALLLVAALLVAYQMFKLIPHYPVIHINDHWHLTLVGAEDVSELSYHAAEFTQQRRDRANLWLTGGGQLTWDKLVIEVKPEILRINGQAIPVSQSGGHVHIAVNREGYICKGRLQRDD